MVNATGATWDTRALFLVLDSARIEIPTGSLVKGEDGL